MSTSHTNQIGFSPGNPFGDANPLMALPRNKEQWRHFLDIEPTTPPPIPATLKQYRALPPDEHELLEEERTEYHGALQLVETAQMRELGNVIRRYLRLNSKAQGYGPGDRGRWGTRPRQDHCRQGFRP